MFDVERAEDLVAKITVITETMTSITDEQRRGILGNQNDRLARIDAVLEGVSANQTQLVALVGALAATLIDYLLDQDRQRDLGIDS